MDVFFPMLNLPSSILVNVLSRLSLKTLCRCRCVCKTFVHLTSDHDFTHVRHNINKIPPMVMMASDSVKEFKLFLVIDPSEDYDGCRCILRLDRSSRVQSIVHSSNGLVVMMNKIDNRLYLCNPLLRDYVKLPRLETPWRSSYTYGFGYTPVTKQYKLIRMTASSDWEKAEFDILTLGTSGTWRQLSIAAPYPQEDFEMFNLNGGFQWRYDDSIYVFDIAEERIQIFPVSTNDKESPVIVGSSSLSLIHNKYEDIDIWFLKDYYGDNKESWTKVQASNNLKSSWFKPPEFHSTNGDLSSTNSMIRKVIKEIQKMTDDHVEDITRCVAFDYAPSFIRSKDIFYKKNSKPFNW